MAANPDSIGAGGRNEHKVKERGIGSRVPGGTLCFQRLPHWGNGSWRVGDLMFGRTAR
jgi:hypothetical protein